MQTIVQKIKSLIQKMYASQADRTDLPFMPPVIMAKLEKPHHKAPLLLFSSLGFFIVFFIWASIAEIDEVSKGDGKIIPSSQIQKISHLEGGIVQKILIKEGTVVQKNQIIMRINNTIAEARVVEGKDLYYRYLTAAERLKAQIDGRPFVIPDVVQKNAPKIGEKEMIRYHARLEKLKNDVGIAKQEAEQKEEELNDFKVRTVQLKQEYSLALEQIALTEPLVKQGLVAKLDLLKLKREAAEIRGRLESTQVGIQKAEAALRQTRDKENQVPVLYRNEDFNELQDANNRLGNATGSFTSEGDRLSRTDIRSPVKGIVKRLIAGTVGGVVKPGDDIVEIVPLEDTLLVEIKLKPSDVAFIHPGQKATIRITAYDSSIYGTLEGIVVNISPDTIVDESDPHRLSYFMVQLRTRGTRLSKSNVDHPLIPGMIVSGDILTGKRTVLHYLLKPIIKSKDVAFTER